MPSSQQSSTTSPSLSAAARASRTASAEGHYPSAAKRSGSAHLAVSGISRRFGERRVLSDISFTASPGDRIGLIGENGTGKSTLLRIIAGHDRPDSGTVSPPGSVGLLRQELPYPDDAPITRVIDDAQAPALAVLAELERLGSALGEHPDDASVADAYGDALESAERAGAWSAEARRGEILAGLGLGGIAGTRPIGELSGGQRLRLALAAILLEAPHTLLLDEPSNHLDDASAAYLERVLAGWPGIVVVASHDRALLDAVTTRILDLDALPVPARVLADAAMPARGGGAERAPSTAERGDADENSADETDDPGSGFGARLWGVGYSAARVERAAEMRRWRERYAAESDERDELIREIEVGSREVNRKHESKSEAKITRKFYADKDARVTARRARNARVRLEALERERVRRPPAPLRFRGFELGAPDPQQQQQHQQRRSDVRSAFPQDESAESVLKNADLLQERPPSPAPGTAPLLRAERVALAGRLGETSLEIPTGGRLMLTGPNGAGKSTLLAILAGELSPGNGTIERAPGVRLGYLPQEVSFTRPERSATAWYREAVGADLSDRLPLTETGLLAARDAERAVGSLSVGQRRRLALAALVADPPDLLILDEPSNHLSLTLVEELEAALETFTGALVIATHDRWLRSRWRGETIAL